MVVTHYLSSVEYDTILLLPLSCVYSIRVSQCRKTFLVAILSAIQADWLYSETILSRFENPQYCYVSLSVAPGKPTKYQWMIFSNISMKIFSWQSTKSQPTVHSEAHQVVIGFLYIIRCFMVRVPSCSIRLSLFQPAFHKHCKGEYNCNI